LVKIQKICVCDIGCMSVNSNFKKATKYSYNKFNYVFYLLLNKQIVN
jgi:hypothetical protein